MSKGIIAIIPARGGSKGIPNKNIIDFLGKPLIAHTIEYVKQSTLVSEIYVSTDNKRISDISKQLNVQIIDRPKSISGDNATTESTIEHALQVIPKVEIIILLQATSPLRPKNSLDTAIKSFLDNKYDSLLSISPNHDFIWKINGNECVPQYNIDKRVRRQDILKSNKLYRENGSIYICSKKFFLKSKNRLGGKIGYIIFDDIYGYEIDEHKDLNLLQKLSELI